MLAEECEKALASSRLARRSPHPPGRASNGSGFEKSPVGAVTAATRAASSAVRGTGEAAASAAAGSSSRASANRIAYWNTASGLSRLSDPSKAIASSDSAETARSIDRVCAISASIAPITSASPAALPVASIWS